MHLLLQRKTHSDIKCESVTTFRLEHIAEGPTTQSPLTLVEVVKKLHRMSVKPREIRNIPPPGSLSPSGGITPCQNSLSAPLRQYVVHRM